MAPGDVVGLPLASCGLPLPYLGSAASAVELALALALHCQCSGKRQLETEFTTTALKAAGRETLLKRISANDELTELWIAAANWTMCQ